MPETMVLSSSMQDYLEAILELAVEENSVRITDIANKLNIAKASVNQTIGKFKEMGLVRQQAYGPVELTDDGRQLAKKVRLRHRMLRQFLIEALGVDPGIAEKDACLMEHAVSPMTIDKLTEFLFRNGYMAGERNMTGHKDNLDAAGGPAVEEKGENAMDTANIKALSNLRTGQKGKVIKVSSKGLIRKRIIEMGITAGTEILVKGFAPFGDPMELGVKGYNLSLRKSEADDILVEVL